MLGLHPTEEEHGLFIDIHPVSVYTLLTFKVKAKSKSTLLQLYCIVIICCYWIQSNIKCKHTMDSTCSILGRSQHSISVRFSFWTLTGPLQHLGSFLFDTFCGRLPASVVQILPKILVYMVHSGPVATKQTQTILPLPPC